jgi:hypothetical protein
MADDLGADLDQLLAQAGQRLRFRCLRHRQRAHEVAKVVGERVELEAHGICPKARDDTVSDDPLGGRFGRISRLGLDSLNGRNRRSAGIPAWRREGLKCAESGHFAEPRSNRGVDPKRPAVISPPGRSGRPCSKERAGDAATDVLAVCCSLLSRSKLTIPSQLRFRVNGDVMCASGRSWIVRIVCIRSDASCSGILCQRNKPYQTRPHLITLGDPPGGGRKLVSSPLLPQCANPTATTRDPRVYAAGSRPPRPHA